MLLIRTMRVSRQFPCKVDAQTDEYEHGRHLSCQSCNHDVDPHVSTRFIITRRSYRTTSSLEHQRNEITKYEETCDGSRLEQTEAGTIDSDHPSETEVERQDQS